MTEDLSHFGVKGMKWGVRKEDRTPAQQVRRDQYKKAAIVLGSAAAIAVIAAGAYYVNQNSNGELGKKLVDSIPPPKSTVKKFAESMAKEPVSIVHSSRGRNRGYGFPQDGGLSDPTDEFIKAGFDGQSSQSFTRYGDRSEKVAASFLDPKGRKDFAGRPISHDVILPEELAKNVNTIEDVEAIAWPKIKDKFDAFYEEESNRNA